ncbi:TIGR02594 family protein [Pararhizobium sp. LjRoot238]|uniref:TIGR02594 family protein n=1 Tax=Pararhizobium sp. LjRoot238 TaxID=3342293 RepID=UPI003ECF6224
MKTILDIQRRLLALGYSVGPAGADGVMGADTEKAIIAFKVANGLQARPYIGPITLEKLFGFAVAGQRALGTGEPRWLTFARRYSGLHEIKGKNHAPEILAMWKATGLPFTDDETPWCASMVGFVLESVGIASTRSGMARSYEKWGVKLAKPAVGCIVTFKRNGGGHVGFVTGRDAQGNLMVLGGNQADAVNIKPFAVSRVTGYWWPKGEPLPEGAIPTVESDGKLSTNEA